MAMYFAGVNLNMLSMGGLALAIGMLVDNSIVVIENIYRLIGEGKSKKEAAGANGAGGDDEVDELFYDALKFVIEAGQASISMIIRRFPMGWNRAGRLLQEMEDRGFVSQYEGSKPRQVLITMDQYEKLIGNE